MALVGIGALWVPFAVLAGLPVDYVLDGGRFTVRRRRRREKVFHTTGRVERFQDGRALRRRRYLGSGRARYAFIVSATAGLPRGPIHSALSDRDRAVLVHLSPRGVVVISPAEPDAFVSGNRRSRGRPAVDERG